MRFHDRAEAGRRLSAALSEFKGSKTVVIVALPRGGVVVAAEIAAALDLPLDIVVPRKIAAPDDPEYALGALAESGEVVWGGRGPQSGAWVTETIVRERAESERRLERYRRGRPPRDFEGKTLIVVDDGVATGLTMEAALRTLRTMRPRSLVLAVPHGAADSLQRLRPLADREVVLYSTPFYDAVGAFYDEFPQVEDAEVVALMTATSFKQV